MIISKNTTSFPMPPIVGVITTIVTDGGYYSPSTPVGPGTIVKVFPSPQIVGLVPVFDCTNGDCRYGKDGQDSVSDDRNFQIPVFAQVSPGAVVDPYFNDANSWLFNLNTGATYNFYLDELQAGVWTQRRHLVDNALGTYYPLGSLCTKSTWGGFNLQWYKVLQTYGEGIYRFRMQLNQIGDVILKYNVCFETPPFCLKTFDCYQVDRTTKFEANYSGGIIGNIDKTNCGGQSWSFCCVTAPQAPQPITSTPISWSDSIRVGGYFGDEDTDYEKKQLKYQFGFIKKVRDEAILKLHWNSSNLPWWFHERFKVYGLLADQLLVSDYNIYNDDYNIKRYCIVLDGSYNPIRPTEGKGSRYKKVVCDFKAGIQYLIRTRCCDGTFNPTTKGNG